MTMTGSCGGPPEFRNVNTFDYMYGTLYYIRVNQAFRLGPLSSLQPKVSWTVQQLFDLCGSDRLAQ